MKLQCGCEVGKFRGWVLTTLLNARLIKIHDLVHGRRKLRRSECV